jgi:hypothetical protein
LLKALDEFQAWVKAQRPPESRRKRGNRARPEAVEDLLVHLVLFYERHGGKVGKGPRSPGARFIFAAANPVLATTYYGKLAPSAISSLIRRCMRLFGEGLATRRPELGTPTLTINGPGCV